MNHILSYVTLRQRDPASQVRRQLRDPVAAYCQHVCTTVDTGHGKACTGKFHSMARIPTSKVQQAMGIWLVPLNDVAHESRFGHVSLLGIKQIIIRDIVVRENAHARISIRARADASAS